MLLFVLRPCITETRYTLITVKWRDSHVCHPCCWHIMKFNGASFNMTNNISCSYISILFREEVVCNWFIIPFCQFSKLPPVLNRHLVLSYFPTHHSLARSSDTITQTFSTFTFKIVLNSFHTEHILMVFNNMENIYTYISINTSINIETTTEL